jgi:hypothetical protein
MAGRPRRHLPARSAVDQSARPICDISRHSSFIVITIVTPHHALKFQGCVESHSPNLTGVLCRPWPCCWVKALLGYRIRSSDRVGVDGARRQSFKRSAFHQCHAEETCSGWKEICDVQKGFSDPFRERNSRHWCIRANLYELAGHILCRPVLGGLHHQYGRV